MFERSIASLFALTMAAGLAGGQMAADPNAPAMTPRAIVTPPATQTPPGPNTPAAVPAPAATPAATPAPAAEASPPAPSVTPAATPAAPIPGSSQVPVTAAPAVAPATQAAAGDSAVPTPAENAAKMYSQANLEEFAGPIALYPDPLLAQVLAASVYPQEVAEAYTAHMAGAKAADVDLKDWESPVKAVAKIPDVIKMMGQYPDWVAAIGQAYVLQSQDLMAAIQSLRATAKANGALQDTEQQKVVTEQQTIVIQPTNPQVIYVPQYNPSYIYVQQDNDDAFLAGMVGFGVGIMVGSMWDMDCNWHGGCVGWHSGGWYGNNNVDIDIDIDNSFNNIDMDNVNWGQVDRDKFNEAVDRSNIPTEQKQQMRNRQTAANEKLASAPRAAAADARTREAGKPFKPNDSKAVKPSAVASPKADGFRGKTASAAATADRPNMPGGATRASGASAVTPSPRSGSTYAVNDGAQTSREGNRGQGSRQSGVSPAKPAAKPATKTPAAKPTSSAARPAVPPRNTAYSPPARPSVPQNHSYKSRPPSSTVRSTPSYSKPSGGGYSKPAASHSRSGGGGGGRRR